MGTVLQGPLGPWRSKSWRRLLVLTLLLTSVPFSVSAPVAVAACPGGDVVATSRHSLERVVFCEVNSVRASHGLRRLGRDSRLSRAAARHARDMLRRRYFSHRSPDGTTGLTRVRRARYGAKGDEVFVGEVLGVGLAGTVWALTPRALVRMWLESPKHRRVLVSRRYRDLGVGAVFFQWGATPAFVVAADLGWHRRRPVRSAGQ